MYDCRYVGGLIMRCKEIIIDVLRDYKNDEYGEKSENDALERICEKYKELDDESIYGICMYYLFYFKSVKEDEGVLSNDAIEEKFTKSLPNEMDELLSRIELFKWVPESYSKVLKLSSEIFEEAKEAYFNGEVSVQEAEQKLEEIMTLRKEIESQEYKYRNRSEIIEEYEAELSECILDVDTIRGERFVQSMRLGNYIDEVDETSEVQATPEFNDTNIFNMPDKLF